jgi:hypothetical protein
MTYRGTIQNGVVVFPNGTSLPDGTVVTVVLSPAETAPVSSSEMSTIWQVESEPCDLPSDLAANHDHYLHGLPKR